MALGDEVVNSPPSPPLRGGRGEDEPHDKERGDAARLEPYEADDQSKLKLTRHRFAGKSVALAADFSCRGGGEMRGAAQRVGVAIAFQEIAPRHGGLRLVDVEFHRQFGIARL